MTLFILLEYFNDVIVFTVLFFFFFFIYIRIEIKYEKKNKTITENNLLMLVRN